MKNLNRSQLLDTYYRTVLSLYRLMETSSYTLEKKTDISITLTFIKYIFIWLEDTSMKIRFN